MQTFKIYVGTTSNDLKLVAYLSRNISVINAMGVKISITHLKKSDMSSDLVESLNRRGISRLPVMIAGKKKFVGVTKIISVFNTNVKNYQNMNQRGSYDELSHEGWGGKPQQRGNTAPRGSTPSSIEDYMASVMQEGEDETIGEETDDMMRKYANATTGRQSDEPKPKRPSSVDSFSTPQRNFDDYGDGDDGYDDNIASDDIMSSAFRSRDGSADDQMTAALLDRIDTGGDFDMGF